MTSIIWTRIFSFMSILTMTLAAPETCVENLYAYSGVIKSLNFPHPYPSGRNCTWIISTIPSYRIQLNFEHFDLEGDDNLCNFDFLSVYNGATDGDKLLGKFCGNDIPKTVFASRNVLRIVFISDARVEGTGFNATFTSALCGENFQQNNGSFQTPHLPAGYPGQKECLWTIEVAENLQATLTFTSIQIPKDSNCLSEYIEVRTRPGGDNDEEAVLARICREKYEQKLFKLQSSTNRLVIRWVFNEFSQRIQFSASFIGEPCGGHYEQDEGILVSPGYPSPYPNDKICNWTLSTEKGSHMWLSFDSFEIWQSHACVSDYVQVRDGLNESSLSTPKLFCGHSVPPLVATTSNNMKITFKSDSSLTAGGFFARFKKGLDQCMPNKSCTHNCYNTFDSHQCYCQDNFHLTSMNTCVKNTCSRTGLTLIAFDVIQRVFSHPRIGFNNYADRVHCNWTINALNKHKRIVLSFEVFDVELCNDCSCDFVKVYDNQRRTYSVFCGKKIPEPLILGSSASIIFKTDGGARGAGFKISYKQI